MLNGCQHCHEQHSPHRGPPATYSPFAPVGTAITIEGSDPDQGCDLLVGKHAEFRQIGQQGIDDLGADARHREQDGAAP